MKLLIALLISASTYGQKKDSVPPKIDSTAIIMWDFLLFLQDKITVKDYMPFEKAANMYLQSKFIKPKKK